MTVNAMIEDIFSGEQNLSMTERAVSVALGLGIAAAAAQPRPNKFLSLAALVIGVGLAVRGATGHCAVKAAAGGGRDLTA
ncbi:YgaP-like transmembrane domain [Methylorubrum zatmanii]|uniref:YgaP-like transmembrane domain n=1 Tax=Methylorubrum zatmanii TaxID=29429 RepID=A0ABW1WIN4_9HYPH|nr:YgaP-like transmembrane domain [Methylorubrum zatmanii]